MRVQPKVSVITVNYKQTDVTIQMLQTLRHSTWQCLEVIVVDNGAECDQSDLFRVAYSDAIVITSLQNLGFAGGNNLGLEQATGDFLFLLNNDAFIEPDTIQQLVEALQSSPEIGAISPKIKYFGTNQIQYAGFSPISRYTGRSIAFGKWQEDHGQCNESLVVAYTHGAAMMITRAVYNAVGPMDESYFLYYEELDWCERIRQAGYLCYYKASATVYHAASASTGVGSPFQTYYLTRNRILFQNRWSTTTQFVVFFAYYTATLALKIIQSSFTGKKALGRALQNGYFDGFKKISKRQPTSPKIARSASPAVQCKTIPV